MRRRVTRRIAERSEQEPSKRGERRRGRSDRRPRPVAQTSPASTAPGDVVARRPRRRAHGPVRVRARRRRTIEPHVQGHRRERPRRSCCAGRRSARCSPPHTTSTREHKIIAALGPTAVPVPEALGSCVDAEVNGAPFYVMSFVDGVIVRDVEAGRALTTEATRERDGTLARRRPRRPARRRPRRGRSR